MIIKKKAATLAAATPGTLQDGEIKGHRNIELFCENTGGTNPLTACVVSVGPSSGSPLIEIDTATFATLAAGASAKLPVTLDCGYLKVVATSTVGTDVELTITCTSV